MAEQAFPKPRRLKDSAAVTLFALLNRHCAVRGCRYRAHAHHIKPKSLGGADAEENLLPLCLRHHTGAEGPHALGHKTWLRRFRDKLSDSDAAKVRAALGLDSEEG
jgi:5-methylcytosine-specific restriction endonuclease McrA